MTKKRSRKRPIVGAGAIPAIFVKVRSNQGYLGYEYKHASIQVRPAPERARQVRARPRDVAGAGK